jgi:hypothetical protein
VLPGDSGPQEHDFSSISPARSRWIAYPAGQGFMSTQRRENRWQRTSCTASARASKAPGDSSSSLEWGVSGQAIPSPLALFRSANATVGTAPPGFPARFHPSDEGLSPGSLEQLATISLQSGYRIVQLVLQELRHGSLPPKASLGEETGTPANHGSSLPRISSLSRLPRLHRILVRVPAGGRRWAERYDGKGNMYLQHAA